MVRFKVYKLARSQLFQSNDVIENLSLQSTQSVAIQSSAYSISQQSVQLVYVYLHVIVLQLVQRITCVCPFGHLISKSCQNFKLM